MTYQDAIAFVWRYWRAYPRTLACLFVGIGAMILCDVFLPIFAGNLVDAVAAGAGAPERIHIIAALLALAGILGMEGLYGILRYVVDRIWIWLATMVMSRMVKDGFYRVQRFSTDWHANSFGGATVRKITRGMWAYDLFADTVYMGLVPSALIIVGMTIMIGMHWVGMAIFLGTFLVAYIAISYLIAIRYNAPANQAFNDGDTRLGAVLADSITCNPTVKSFGAEAREDAALHRTTERWAALARYSWTRGTNTGAVQAVLNILMLSGLLGFSIWFWSRGAATPGQVTMVLTSFFVISRYVRHISMHLRNFQKSVNEMEDLAAFMRTPFGVDDKAGARAFEPGRGEIAFDRVTFQYENQPAALFEDFSLKIEAGERVALVGHSGSGKSTVVKLIQRLYDVNAGAIHIDGQDIAEVTQESLRRNIALVPQEPILFHRSLAENIAYGRPEATMDDIVEAAKQAHAHEFISSLAQGYDTLVGERGVKLSGGERQRVAIARAFLADCPILILDEATSSLDSHTEGYIQESIHALMEGRTTIVIAHRLSTIRAVDRILVFDAGRIIEEGAHGTLMANPQSPYRALVAAQMRGGMLIEAGPNISTDAVA